MSAIATVGRRDRFAIFWGGGLGDILVLRPLLIALAERLETPPLFFTTASHLQGLFDTFGLKVELHVLPVGAAPALRHFRGLSQRFDWLYLGAYPRLKTRLLAKVVGAERIWDKRHTRTQAFIGEQVLADVHALGLNGSEATRLPYGGGWPTQALRAPRPYVVLHSGAKERWETTRWPAMQWQGLLRELLAGSDLDLKLVGVESERAGLETLVQDLESKVRARVSIETALPLPALAATLEASRGVVCHNSGVLHLAAMLGKPTVAITGSSARFWRPPYGHVQNVTSGACELACNQYRCPVPFYRARCIRELDVATVLTAVREKLLARP